MSSMTRRTFAKMALAMGATAVWGDSYAAPSRIPWRECPFAKTKTAKSLPQPVFSLRPKAESLSEFEGAVEGTGRPLVW
jgi:hypothetical protein